MFRFEIPVHANPKWNNLPNSPQVRRPAQFESREKVGPDIEVLEFSCVVAKLKSEVLDRSKAVDLEKCSRIEESGLARIIFVKTFVPNTSSEAECSQVRQL